MWLNLSNHLTLGQIISDFFFRHTLGQTFDASLEKIEEDRVTPSIDWTWIDPICLRLYALMWLARVPEGAHAYVVTSSLMILILLVFVFVDPVEVKGDLEITLASFHSLIVCPSIGCLSLVCLSIRYAYKNVNNTMLNDQFISKFTFDGKLIIQTFEFRYVKGIKTSTGNYA